MKKTLLFALFLFSFSFAKSQSTTIGFQVVVVFKPATTWADITSIKTALNAVQLDSTSPSRALLWQCSATIGATITIPKFGGGTVTSLSITSGGGGSEAVGVICNSGQSEGVSLNDVYIIPEPNNPTDTFRQTAIASVFPTTCNVSSSDSIMTCRATDRAVLMAILDSGVDITGLDATNNIVIRHDSIRPFIAYRNSETVDNVDSDGNGYKDDQIGFDFVNNQGIPKDSTGHGTFVTGLVTRILKRNSSVNIKIYALKVLDKQNRGREYNIIRAIDWAVKNKVQVANCSFINSDELTDTMQPLASAINTAQRFGLLVSVAAGNKSRNLDFNWYGAASFQSQNMIVTGATSCTDSIAWFSNFGKRNTDMFTIGKDLVSTWLNNQYAIHSGTSYAAPQTSAVAALLFSRQTSFDWTKVKCALLNGASYRPFLIAKSRRSGILNAVNAANLLNTTLFPCDGLVNTEGVQESLKNVSVYPNPTQNDVSVHFYLTKNTAVQVTVFNAVGQNITTHILNGFAGQNEYPLSIKGENGVYFVQIRVGNELIVRKVVKFEPR
ncbi:MAG: S8 family peptidase [Saprospiraceae bacterium]|nr:S8 family peptidase [Saprospiraceae bacterium]